MKRKRAPKENTIRTMLLFYSQSLFLYGACCYIVHTHKTWVFNQLESINSPRYLIITVGFLLFISQAYSMQLHYWVRPLATCLVGHCCQSTLIYKWILTGTHLKNLKKSGFFILTFKLWSKFTCILQRFQCMFIHGSWAQLHRAISSKSRSTKERGIKNHFNLRNAWA